MQAHALLRADRPLMHEEGACLPLRSSIGECEACQNACPSQALSVSVSGVELSEACVSCGRCVAVCPTQALYLPAINDALEAALSDTSGERVLLECEMVPSKHRAITSLTLPCLGSLTPGFVLSAQAESKRVEVMDRGWCADCSVNAACEAGEHPAHRALDEANAWLEALDGQAPPASIIRSPLPVSLKMALQESSPPEEKLDRRSFFREVIARPAGAGAKGKAEPMGSDGRAAYPASKRHSSAERDRQLRALTKMSAHMETNVPPEFFPTLHVDASCCDDRMCVALCPTGALSIKEFAGWSQLVLNSDTCITCSNCVKACSQGALTIEPYKGEGGQHVLIQHTRSTCSNCGDRFTPTAQQATQDAEESDVCLLCSKSRNLVADIGRALRS